MSNVSKKMSDFRNCEKSCFSTFPKRLFWSIKILIFCTSLIWEMAVVESQILDAETVTIKQGVVKGSTKVLNGQRLSTFLGIPYAEPPVGNRRLRPTSPHPGWKGRKGSFFIQKWRNCVLAILYQFLVPSSCYHLIQGLYWTCYCYAMTILDSLKLCHQKPLLL